MLASRCILDSAKLRQVTMSWNLRKTSLLRRTGPIQLLPPMHPGLRKPPFNTTPA